MTHLKVAVRVRPLSKREVETDSISVIEVENENSIAITNIKVPEQNAGDSRERTRRFTFDYAFNHNSTQDQVFEAVENVIGKAIKSRHHSCVLAYGQSSSGKTHTMMGFPHDPGLTPKLCQRLFSYLEETAVGSEISDMKISVSYLEIYNEKVRDLLYYNNEKFEKKKIPLKIREHPKKGPYVQGLTEHPVNNSEDLIKWLESGNNNRRVAATVNNPQSSRSHSVFSVNCGGVKLHLVDLAGSERAGSRCYCTSRFREGANINKSLVALGNVISALAEQASKHQQQRLQPSKNPRRRFVPYRDSVLTWLLKDTLAGNSNTVMIATVSPSSACYSESVNTLRFGQRAKLIRSRPILHLEDPNETTIRELRAEIARLRELLKLQTQFPLHINQDPMFESSTTISANSNKNILSENDSGLNTCLSDTSSCPSPILERNKQFDQVDRNVNHVSGPFCESVVNIKDNEFANSEVGDEDLISENTLKLESNYTSTNSISEILDENSDHLDSQTSITNTLANNFKEKEKKKDNCTTERLLPLINISDTIINKRVKKLHRTYSVEHPVKKMEKEKPKLFSSHENIRKSSISSLPPLVRRQSTIKSNISPKSSPKRKINDNTNKIEKGIVTEVKGARAKVDSIRKAAVKPRSQIVAAVTNRLYSKSKKKEASTDTDDINTYDKPKELNICSNARLRLKELTHRALKAHRSKTEETQTDLFPVLRIKEISTDVSDLKHALLEVKDTHTSMENILTSEKAIDCNLLDNFQNLYNHGLIITKTCGTQANIEAETPKEQKNTQNQSSVSFTKYLRDSQSSKYEIVSESCPNHPIYTSSVNINISHNYINSNRTGDTNSDDSLEDNPQNVNLPTPDLISNHNSLEQNALSSTNISNNENNDIISQSVKYAALIQLPPCNEDVLKEINYLYIDEPKTSIANSIMIPECAEKISSIIKPDIRAAEICYVQNFDNYCASLPDLSIEYARPTIIEPTNIPCIECVKIQEPVILKSIMRQVNNLPVETETCNLENNNYDIPDSLEYHMTNSKKVHFTKSSKMSENHRMIKAMSTFLEEATNLMTNLSEAAQKIERNQNNVLNKEFDLQVTVNEISGLEESKHKRKYRTSPPRQSVNCQTENVSTEEISSQTNIRATDTSTQYDFRIPINKYEVLLEDSCKRLEEKINFIPERVHLSVPSLINEDCSEKHSQPYSFNPWDLSNASNYVEDSSLESNPVTFSDYGSLPRKSYKTHRTPICSPSAYLRQLTNMRRQVIESSREDLLNN